MKSLAVPKETTLSAAQDQTTNKDDVSVRSSDPDPAGERKHQYELPTRVKNGINTQQNELSIIRIF